MIINQRIVIVHPFFDVKNINGNFFYLEEMAQYIYDNFTTNIAILNISKLDRKLLTCRYNFLVKETEKIQNNDIIICAMHSIPYILFDIDKIDKVFIMESANTYDIEEIIGHKAMFGALKNNKKFFLLSQPEFTKIKKSALFENRIIDIIRGFYFKHYVSSIKNTNEWLLQDNVTDNDIYTYNKLHDAKKYCIVNKIHYVNSTNIDSLNPANDYDGLLYIRDKDFMPRLPYEFWFYNKPIIFFSISTGLLKKFSSNEIPLCTKVIKQQNMFINLNNMMELIC